MELSTILIDTKEDQKVVNKYTDARRQLVLELNARGFPAEGSKNLPVDLMWSAGGRSVMFDLATPDDMMKKASDGRLHTQSEAMKARDCLLWGFLIEGGWGGDGITVGYGKHAWAAERLDNLVLSLQCEGAKIVHSARPDRTAVRIGSLYRWTAKDTHGEWHHVKPHTQLAGVYLDKTEKKQVEFLMSIPGIAEERAVRALRAHPLSDLVRVDDQLVSRWESVHGIGKKLAEGVYRFLTEEVNDYTALSH